MPPKPALPASAFFTKETAETGVRVPLSLPNGEKTEEWFHLIGTDSEAFRVALVGINQRFLGDAGKVLSPEDQAKQREEKNLLIAAAAITSWSFAEPCDEKNKLHVLRNAPAFFELVNRFSGNRANFFTPPAKAS